MLADAQASDEPLAMTPDEAERLLGMLRLDGNRKLSLGGDEPGKPRAGKLRDW